MFQSLQWRLLGILGLLQIPVYSLLYPQESLTREMKSLDGLWKFRLSPSLQPQTGTVFENHRKVSFSLSEASYVYILSGQKFLKNGKNVFFLKSLIWWSNSVTRPVIFKRTKIVLKCHNCKNATFWDIFKPTKWAKIG